MRSHVFTGSDITELTGYQEPAKKKQCIDKHGIDYIEGKASQARAARAHAHQLAKPRQPKSELSSFNLGYLGGNSANKWAVRK